MSSRHRDTSPAWLWRASLYAALAALSLPLVLALLAASGTRPSVLLAGAMMTMSIGAALLALGERHRLH